MEETLIREVLEKFGPWGLILVISVIITVKLWKELKKKEKLISDKDKIILDIVGDFHKVATKSVDVSEASTKTLTEIHNLLHTVNTDVQIIKSNGAKKHD